MKGTKETKKGGVIVDVDFNKSKSSAAPPVKKRLEKETKETKASLDDIKKKLTQANNLREKMMDKRKEKLRKLTDERMEKVKQKRNKVESELKEQKKELSEDLQEAEQRRNEHLKNIVGKLQEENGKVAKASAEVKHKKSDEKELDDKTAQAFNIDKETKLKKHKKTEDTPITTEKKQLQTEEKPMSHIQGVKSITKEAASKTKNSQTTHSPPEKA